MTKAFLLFFALVLAMSFAARSAEHEVNILKYSNFTASEKAKTQKAAQVIKVILNSLEFKERITNHTWQGKRQFVDTKLSNPEVYAKIMRGAETYYKPEADGNMDIGLEMYRGVTSTIGYTYPKSDTIWMNRKYHDKMDSYDQTNNMVHEWTHKLGFDHAQNWSLSRDYSVPYGVGTIVEELAAILKANPNGLTRLDYQPGPVVEPKPEPLPEPVKQIYCSRSWRTLWKKYCWEE